MSKENMVESEMVKVETREAGCVLQAARLYEPTLPVCSLGVAFYKPAYPWHGGSRKPVHFISDRDCRKLGLVPEKGRGLAIPDNLVQNFADNKLNHVPGGIDWDALRYSPEIFGYG